MAGGGAFQEGPFAAASRLPEPLPGATLASRLLRYPRLYLYFLRFSLSRAMEFRVDFYFRVLMDVVFYVVNIAFFSILYRHTSLLGGWDLDQIYVFVCCYLFVDALHMTVFSNNMWWLPIFINRGDLDYYLVRPVSSLFFLSLRDFAANSFLNLVIASGLVGWALVRYPHPLTAGRVVAFLLFLVLGTLLTYMTRLLFIIPTFWLHSGKGMLELSWTLTTLGERPVQIYDAWLRRTLTTVLPLAFLATVPASVLFDGLTAAKLLLALAVITGLGAFDLWLWQRGLRAYSSASS
jgi:ABC-2 type transport system permease protein